MKVKYKGKSVNDFKETVWIYVVFLGGKTYQVNCYLHFKRLVFAMDENWLLLSNEMVGKTINALRLINEEYQTRQKMRLLLKS